MARYGHPSEMVTSIGTSRIVIVGGGMAGGSAAVTLREEGFGGQIAILTQEPGVPFRPTTAVQDLLAVRGGPERLVCQARQLVRTA
jgi:3-phenylpropionate/trans-cinnamate dioxygenase ferredoxin reductase component